MLTLYRTGLRLRREHPALGDGGLMWCDSGPEVLDFTREPGFRCVVNFSTDEISLPVGSSVLLASAELPDGRLPPDTAAWLGA